MFGVEENTMLIQATSPRPMLNATESPQHIRIHTLRKLKVSKGEVTLVLGEKQIEVEPYEVYPIDGEPQFEALEYFLPFWRVFGTEKPTYNETKIRENIEHERFKRVRADAQKDKLLGTPEKLTGVQLAMLGSTGYHIIVRSAYRTEGATYEERIANFTIHCPVNGGGMIRMANCPIDIANPTFDPYAADPGKSRGKDLVLLEAFNRTHKLRTADIEERKRKRIAEAEANIQANERALGSNDPKRLPRSDG
jgi:hypothetical protein